MKRQFQAFSYKVANIVDDTLDVFIDGTIVDAETQQILKDWFGDDTSVSYKSFRDQVTKASPKVLNIFINSGGGLVTDAMAIHDFIHDQQNKGVTVNTIGRGIIGSAATYLLMAGGKRSRISSNSWFMIHNVSGFAYGDVNMVENQAKTMRKFNDMIVGFYASATGLTEKEIGRMMDEETWMTGKEATEKGFVKNLEDTQSFTNKIEPEHWPFANKNVLNCYNSAVKLPEAAPANEDHKNFFQTIKSDFMSLINELKGAITNGKKDDKTKDIADRDAILDMVEKVLTPFVNKVDEAIAALPKNEADEKKEDDQKDEKKDEKKNEKKDEKPADVKKEDEEDDADETVENKKLKADLENLKKENAKLKADMAKNITKPANVKTEEDAALMSKVTAEYA